MSDDRLKPMPAAARAGPQGGLEALYRALVPLRSVVSVLQTGAHPDDETSALLARLSLGDGADVAYACATRGEGGQNAIGAEAGAGLALVRSAEMAQAARALDLTLYWLNESHEGPITDFGFSKSAEETVRHWGEDRLVERLVHVIRHFRPDIVLPTFLDVPGQHGHHRAVTRATERAVALAGSAEAWPEHAGKGLETWAPHKFYLPAWSGAGTSYDDDVPPPPATVTVETGTHSLFLGAGYHQIGEGSLACHRTQGMGRRRPEGPAPVPLHLKRPAAGREGSLFDGLPRRLADLDILGNGALEAALRAADEAIDRALTVFPDFPDVASALAALLACLDRAETAGPPPVVAGKLAVKRRQARRALVRALGLVVRLRLTQGKLIAGRPARAHLTVYRGGDVAVELTSVRLTGPEAWRIDGPEGAAEGPLDRGQTRSVEFGLTLPADTPPSHPYRFCHGPEADGLLRATVGLRLPEPGLTLELPVSADEPTIVLPPLSVRFRPEREVLVQGRPGASAELHIEARNWSDIAAQAQIGLDASRGWSTEPAALGLSLAPGATATLRFEATPPADPAAGEARFALWIEMDGRRRAGQTVTLAEYAHIAPSAMTRPAEARLAALDLALPDRARIGVVDCGADHVADWVRRLGLPVTRLRGSALESDDFSNIDTLVVGIFSFGRRADLAAARTRIHDWVHRGGHLVTLYHRPWDGWDPAATPPLRLEIGQPSIRWRVTDAEAPVTVLAASHPLLRTPNRIGPQDWQGWVKERGLYFAKSWDPAYTPLVAMSDPNEAPLTGGLLSAAIGRGRHTHVALALHTQLDALVPGAFRLLANLLA